MTEDDYDEAAEETAARWWESLRARSVGTTDIPEWTYIWAAVMLRRYAAEHPRPSLRHRTYRNWVTLINRQRTSLDPEEQHEYQDQIHAFLNAVDSPWSIVYDQGPGKYSINRVATLEEDIAFARDKQRKRMDEEQRLREEADRRVLRMQMSKGLSILPS